VWRSFGRAGLAVWGHSVTGPFTFTTGLIADSDNPVMGGRRND
jgi:hypothetical protein